MTRPAHKGDAVRELRRYARRVQAEAHRINELPFSVMGMGWWCALSAVASELRDRARELSAGKPKRGEGRKR